MHFIVVVDVIKDHDFMGGRHFHKKIQRWGRGVYYLTYSRICVSLLLIALI